MVDDLLTAGIGTLAGTSAQSFAYCQTLAEGGNRAALLRCLKEMKESGSSS